MNLVLIPMVAMWIRSRGGNVQGHESYSCLHPFEDARRGCWRISHSHTAATTANQGRKEIGRREIIVINENEWFLLLPTVPLRIEGRRKRSCIHHVALDPRFCNLHTLSPHTPAPHPLENPHDPSPWVLPSSHLCYPGRTKSMCIAE